MSEKKGGFIVREERRVKRFNLRNAIGSILESFNLERGILFTLVSLIKSPGASTRHYLEAGRLRYISPFRLLLFSTTALVIIFNSTDFNNQFVLGFQEAQKVDGEMTIAEMQFSDGYEAASGMAADQMSEAEKAKAKEISDLSSKLFTEYFNIIIWAYIPILAFFTWLFNRKKDLNYAEHLIFNSFYTSIVNVLTLMFFVAYFVDMQILYLIYMTLSLGYFIYYYRDLLAKTWVRAISEGMLIYLLSLIVYAISMTALVLVYLV